MNEYDEVINGLANAQTDEEFLGAVKKNVKKARKAMKKAASKKGSKKSSTTAASTLPSQSATGSRAEFLTRLNKINPELVKGLKEGKYQLVDSTIYNVKKADGKNVRMFDDADDKIIGLCNISRAKLEKNEVFMLSGIQLLASVVSPDDPTSTQVEDGELSLKEHAERICRNAEWKEIGSVFTNGEFTFRAGTQTLLDRFSNYVFVNHMETSNTNGVTSHGQGLNGYYKLANPKMIGTQEALDMFIEWGSSINSSANTFLKVILYGTKIMSK